MFSSNTTRKTRSQSIADFMHLKLPSLISADDLDIAAKLIKKNSGPQFLKTPNIQLLKPNDTPKNKVIQTNGMRYESTNWPRVLLLCPQGNLTWSNTEQCLGTGGPDFGGQLVYLKELAIALKHVGFPAVDIVTRAFSGKMDSGENWPKVFEEATENHPLEDNLRIVRIKTGGMDFIPKEQLWNTLHDWTRGIELFYTKELEKALNDQTNNETSPCVLAPVVTAHYADGGLSAYWLQEESHFPFATFTAHSLGSQKYENLQKQNTDTDPFNFHFRMTAETIAAHSSRFIITSTDAEVQEQWSSMRYPRLRPGTFKVVPPGIAPIFNGHDIVLKDQEHCHAKSHDPTPQEKADILAAQKAFQAAIKALPEARQQLPIICLCGRLDEKKGYIKVLETYQNSPYLQKRANLALIFGNGHKIFKAPGQFISGTNLKYALRMKAIIDDPKLKDTLILPELSSVRQPHLAGIYHDLATRQQGIYCHSALQEPFGLMVTEAMAAGMLIAATNNGGPNSILDHGKYGELMDVNDPVSIENALDNILHLSKEQKTQRQKRAVNRALEFYSWHGAARNYAKSIISTLLSKQKKEPETTLSLRGNSGNFIQRPKRSLERSNSI